MRGWSTRCALHSGALDYETGKLVLQVLERVNRGVGTTTAMITHNAAIAAMGHRVIRLRDFTSAMLLSWIRVAPRLAHHLVDVTAGLMDLHLSPPSWRGPPGPRLKHDGLPPRR